MSKALVVTIVPPTSGTSPVAVAVSLVLATQPGPEAPPAMRYGTLGRGRPLSASQAQLLVETLTLALFVS